MCAAIDLGICMNVNENLIAAQFKAISFLFIFLRINHIMTGQIGCYC